jgi:hypothetical protein
MPCVSLDPAAAGKGGRGGQRQCGVDLRGGVHLAAQRPIAGQHLLGPAAASGTAHGAMALTGSEGTPGQWSMAGQNIDDTHFQAAEHEIQFIRTAPLAPADQTRVAHVNAERILRLHQ